MRTLLSAVEQCRLRNGLTQGAVAREVGISQPHYSKVVGGLVRLPDDLKHRLSAWLESRADSYVPVQSAPGSETKRIRQLATSIAEQLGELNRLLGVNAGSRKRRIPSRTRRKPADPSGD